MNEEEEEEKEGRKGGKEMRKKKKKKSASIINNDSSSYQQLWSFEWKVSHQHYKKILINYLKKMIKKIRKETKKNEI